MSKISNAEPHWARKIWQKISKLRADSAFERIPTMSSQSTSETPFKSGTLPKGFWFCLIGALLFLVSAWGVWATLKIEYTGFQGGITTVHNNETCNGTTCTYRADESEQEVFASSYTPG